jgi:hypothetical protein
MPSTPNTMATADAPMLITVWRIGSQLIAANNPLTANMPFTAVTLVLWACMAVLENCGESTTGLHCARVIVIHFIYGVGFIFIGGMIFTKFLDLSPEYDPARKYLALPAAILFSIVGCFLLCSGPLEYVLKRDEESRLDAMFLNLPNGKPDDVFDSSTNHITDSSSGSR